MKRRILRLALPLAAAAVVAALALSALDARVQVRAAAERDRQWRQWIEDVLPYPYDNDVLRDRVEVIAPEAFGTSEPVAVYRLRRSGTPVGLVLAPLVAAGYSGPIRLIVGVDARGTISGVRVLEQHETEGLGAAVDQRKSNWLHAFTGRSLDQGRERFALARDGGDFDALTGATITSQSVVGAVSRCLEYVEANLERLYR